MEIGAARRESRGYHVGRGPTSETRRRRIRHLDDLGAELVEQAVHVAAAVPAAGLTKRRRVERYANRRTLPGRSRPFSATRMRRVSQARGAPQFGAPATSGRGFAPRLPRGSSGSRGGGRATRLSRATDATTRDHRRTACHRLGDRHPEPFEAGRVDDGRGAAVEARELLIGHVSQPDDAAAVELRLLAPPGSADDAEEEILTGEQRERVDEHAEVLPGLERRDREHVGRAQIRALAVRGVRALISSVRDDDAVPRKPECLGDVIGGERGVREDQVARLRRVAVLARVHRARPRRRPLRVVHRHEIVHRRGAHAVCLRGVHPVRE